MKTQTKLIRECMKGQRFKYAAAVLSMAGAVCASFLTPLLLGEMIDAVIGQVRPLNLPGVLGDLVERQGGRTFLAEHLWIAALVMVTLNLFGGACQYMRARLSAQASETVALRLRERLYAHLERLPYDYHVKAQTGDLIQRCTSDVETVRKFAATQLVEIFRTIFMIAISLMVMLRIHARLTLVSMLLMPPLFALVYWFFRKVRKYFARVDAAEGRMSAVLQENLAGVRVVRAFGRQRHEVEKFRKANDALYQEARVLNDVMAAFWPSGDFISLSQTALTLIYGIFLAAQAQLTVGEITVFVSYVSMLTWPVRQLGRILSDMGKAVVSLGRIGEVVDIPEEPDEMGALTPPLDRDIAFKHVSFGYEPGNPVLKDVDFTVKAGQTVAVLGGTGSGKSSMMLLMQRLYEPDAGRITIGGVDIRQIKKSHLRARVGLILQEPFLYSRTVGENIAFARGDAARAEVHEAARVASADGFILGFDRGYETPVGERGVTLSGGQKQRVAIARTLLKHSDILIFDDSLSAVDTETDARIRAALKERSGRSTTFIISHRLSTLSEADLILVLEQGRIVERGTHDELIGRDGLYSRVYRIQSLLEEELNAGV